MEPREAILQVGGEGRQGLTAAHTTLTDLDGGERRRETTADKVDAILLQWRAVRPDLDPTPMGVVARISQLARYFERSTAEVMAEFGINEPQFGVLAALRRAAPQFALSPTQLYQSLMITSGAMTNRIDKLEAVGLVRRKRAATDGRMTLVCLTPRGRNVVDRAVEAHLQNESQLLGWLTDVEREDCIRSLRLLLGSFDVP